MIYKEEDVKLEPGKTITLVIPNDDQGLHTEDAINYFAGDGTIRVMLIRPVNTQAAEELIVMCRKLYSSPGYEDVLSVVLVKCSEHVQREIELYPDVYFLKSNADRKEFENDTYPRVIIPTSNLRALILKMSGYVRFPVFTENRHEFIQKMMTRNYIGTVQKAILNGDFTIGLDYHGHLIVRTTTPAVTIDDPSKLVLFARSLAVSVREAEYLAYAGLDFITLKKSDARAIADLLDDEVNRGGGDDVEVFGEMGISYERLHDRLTGLCYQITKYRLSSGCTVDNVPGLQSDKDENEYGEWGTPGYHKTGEEMLILEHPSVDCDHEWTPEEWAVLCKLFSLPADKTERIVINASSIECLVTDEKEDE